SLFAGTFTDGANRVTVDATAAGGTTAFSGSTATIENPVFDATGAWLSNTGNLFVTGTSGSDKIIVRPAAHGRVFVVLNGQVIGNFTRADVTGRIRVRGLEGNDQVKVSTSLANAADVYGGLGNDTLWGGIRGDRLFGEGGNDRLYGRGGNDVLVGGDGTDTLGGGFGRDVVVGGGGGGRLPRSARGGSAGA